MRAAVLPLLISASLPLGAAPASALDEQEPASGSPITAPAMIAPAAETPAASAPTSPALPFQPHGAAPASAAPAAAAAASAPAAAPPAPPATPAYAAPASAGAVPSAQPSTYQSPSVRVAPSIPAPAAPVSGVIEKLGQGDRAFLAGDYRAALFAYQDAVYLAPQYAPARVKLGRAYLALRYATQAITQAEQALAVQPGNEDALRLVQEARNPPPPKPAATVPSVSEQAQVTPRPEASEPSSATQPRVYRFEVEREASAAELREGEVPHDAAQAAGERGGAAREPSAPPGQRSYVAQADSGTGQGYSDPGGARTPAERYRAALELLSRREYPEAIHELTEAIAGNPKLAVAYAARGNAQFGLGKYREASDDYRAAMFIDANLATPVYGLAECLRLLGDRKGSAAMYQRYADSHAKDVREDLRAAATRRVQELR